MYFNKKTNREFFNNKLLFNTVGIIFLIIIFVLVIADFKIYQKTKKLNAQIVAYQKQIGDIKKSSQTLKNEISNSNNTDYLEKLGYEQFDQARPGETEYMFVKAPKQAETTRGSNNFWDIKSWWSWLKSKF